MFPFLHRRHLLTGVSLLTLGLGLTWALQQDVRSPKPLTAQSVTSTIPVAPYPGSAAVAPNGNKVYVVHGLGNAISVITTADHSVATIPLSTLVGRITISPDSTKVYVTHPGSNILSVITTSDNSVRTIPVGPNSIAIGIPPDGLRAYVLDATENSVRVIRTSDDTVIRTVTVGAYPNHIIFNANGSKAYVSNWNDNSVSVILTSTYTVEKTITVGNGADSLALTPDGTKLYVTNYRGNSVSIITTSNNTVIKTVGVGYLPRGIVITPDSARVFVINIGGNSVSAIETTNNSVVATYPVVAPVSMVLPHNSKNVYVVSSSDRTVTPISIDGQPHSAVVVPVGDSPWDIDATPDGSAMYVPNRLDNTVSVIHVPLCGDGNVDIGEGCDDGNDSPMQDGCVSCVVQSNYTCTGSPSVCQKCGNARKEGTEVCDDGNTSGGDGCNATCTATESGWRCFGAQRTTCTQCGNGTTNTGEQCGEPGLSCTGGKVCNSCTCITPLSCLSIGGNPSVMFVSPDGSRVYVLDYLTTSSVKVISTSTHALIATVTVGSSPEKIIFAPDGTKAYVANGGSNTVSIISNASSGTPSVTGTVTLANIPDDIAITPDGSKVYALNIGARSVYVIRTDNNSVMTSVPVGYGPFGIFISPNGSRAYVTNVTGNSVSVISTSTNTVTATVPVGQGPLNIAFMPDGSKAYVTNSDSDSVSVISNAILGTPVVTDTVTVGTNPIAIAITPDGTKAYVSNLRNDSVSVISTVNNAVTATVSAGSNVRAMVITPDGSKVIMRKFKISFNDSLDIISTATNTVTTVPVPYPLGIAITPDGSKVYVALKDPLNAVSVIDVVAGKEITTCATVCGNGIKQGSEACDDGDLDPGDGCSASCTVESGWTCNTATPSVCTSNTGTITGKKIHDHNANGTWQAGDDGLINWTVYVDYNNNGSKDATEPFATTNTSGDYTITTITPGTWTIREVPAADWTCSSPTGGSFSRMVTAGGTITGLDFYNWHSASIAGSKFNDQDADGASREGTEPGLAGWTQYVDYDNDQVLDAGEPSAVSDVNGAYQINGIKPGTWNVRSVPQTNWINSYPAGGAGGSHSKTVVSAGTDTNVYFGSFMSATLSGKITEDRNGNGTFETGDPNLSGWTVYADYDNDGTLDAGEPSAVTNASGDYSIANVTPGTWTIRQVSQPGWKCSHPMGCTYSRTVTGGGNITGLTFMNWRSSTLSGAKFNDLDADGLPKEVGEPGLSGWQIYVDYNDNGILDSATEPFATTDVSGNYSITIVIPGTFKVRSNIQANWTNSFPSGGATGYVTKTFTSGSSFTGVDFGSWTVVCGNWIKEIGEVCDDGDAASGDGCSSSCGLESGWICTGATPTVCQKCGNGITEGNEQCGEPGLACSGGKSCQSCRCVVAGSCYVSVGDQAEYIAFSPDGTKAYVSNYSGNSVSVISTGTNSVTATIPVGMQPYQIVFTPNGAKAYVVNNYGGSVSVITTANSTVSKTVTVGKDPAAIALTPDGTKAYVVNGSVSIGRSISVIETTNDTVVATIPMGKSVTNIAITPDGKKAYVTSGNEGQVTVISIATNTIIATVTVGNDPQAILISPDGTKAYAINRSGNTVAVISVVTDTLIASIPVGTRPSDIAITPDGSKVYVTNKDSDSVSVLSTTSHSVIATIPVGTDPVAVAITPDGSKAYVVRYPASPNSVSVISTASNTVLASISAGALSTAIAISPDGTKAYITDNIPSTTSADINTIRIIDTSTDVSTPSFCGTVCGNGTKETGEACDDGNTVANDGCDATCRAIDPGYTCNGTAPSVCQKCPNGKKEGTEACDDSNSTSNDGCTACVVDSGYTCTGSTPSVCTLNAGTLSGKITEDRNGNGTFETGDPNLSGWTVYADYDNDGTPDVGEPSAVTNASGDYSIANVTPGTRIIRQVLQAGWICSAPMGCTYSRTVTGGSNIIGLTFMNWRPSTLSGTKFNDLDADGQAKESGEPGLSGWSIYVDYNDNGIYESATEPSATTDASGNYSITIVKPGTFKVRSGTQANWTNSFPSGGPTGYVTKTFTSGSSFTGVDFGSWTATCGNGIKQGSEACDDGDQDPGDGCSASCTVESGWTCNTAVSPSVINPSVCTLNTGTIVGEITEDRDGDGIRETGDPNLSGWTVYVDYDNDGTPDAGEPSAVTNASGDYSIANVTPGVRTIRQILQSTWTCSNPPVTVDCAYSRPILDIASSTLTLTFMNWRPSALSGAKFNDLDADGQAKESGEPGLSGWSIYVDYNDNGTYESATEPSATTDASGNYSITIVKPGTFKVRSSTQANWTNSYPSGGATGYVTKTFTSGSSFTGVDFGSWTATCGDGTKEDTEACDDADTTSGDGCSATCAVESGYTCSGSPSSCQKCGNGTKEGTEACDDADTTSGDGCSATCTVETGWMCTGTAPSVCTRNCGDGTKEDTEACDDGDLDPGDGCSATCTIETGWICRGNMPSLCAKCGNGTIENGEICDDGNTDSNDGCDNQCKISSGFICTGTTRSTCTSVSGRCSISVGQSPGNIAIAPDGATVYESNTNSNSVSVISTSTNTVTATIPVGVHPGPMAITPDGSKVYVINYDSNFVSVISTANNTVTASVSVGQKPRSVVITPDGTKAYVPNNMGNSVSVISTATNTVTATVPLAVPARVAVTPDGSKVLVSHGNNVSIIAVATNTVLSTIPVEQTPSAIAISPDGTKAYVGNTNSKSVSVISIAGASVIATVPVGEDPSEIIITSDSSKVYVMNANSFFISVIASATNSVIATVPVGITPADMEITPDGTKLLVADNGSNGVSIISTVTDTLQSAMYVGIGPTSIIVTPDGSKAYIANRSENSVFIINVATAAPLAICGPVCGDGAKAGGEACDDDDLDPGDGCSATCTVETGWMCTGTAPSVCTRNCGNGTKEGAEACDDGNTTSNDGCNADCTIEFGYICTGTTPSVCTFKAAKFDFGTPSSTVESGYIGVQPTEVYTPSRGYGWNVALVSGGGWNEGAVDQGVITDSSPMKNLRRDHHASVYIRTFSVNIPNGTYWVNATMGDKVNGRDSMQIVAEASTANSVTKLVSVAPGQWAQVGFEVTVADGKLDLQFDDLSGDLFWVLNGLEISQLSDTNTLLFTGPGEIPADGQQHTVSGVAMFKGVPLVNAWLTIALDVGTILSDQSPQYAGTQVFTDGNGAFNFTLLVPATPATPTLTMHSLGGGAYVSQNDAAQLAYSQILPLQFDFGTPSSTVESGYIGVQPTEVYTPSRGYGWNVALVPSGGWNEGAVDQGVITDSSPMKNLRRDHHASVYIRTFSVNIPNGTYWVNATMGDKVNGRDSMQIVAEASTANSVTKLVSVAPGQWAQVGFEVTVADGKLDLQFDDLSGDLFWVLNGLEISIPSVSSASSAQSSITPTSTCGNGAKEGTEACDDGDLDPGDGCSATCAVESGYTCTGTAPSVCVHDVTLCSDGLDNDGDGATDLADFSCGGVATHTSETTPKSQCQDGQDNDGDGATDGLDPGCIDLQDNVELNVCPAATATSTCRCTASADCTTPDTCQSEFCRPPIQIYQCSDGLDNDNDGAIDYMPDFSCASPLDNDEATLKAQCQDDQDNDADGLIDGLDPGCSDYQDNTETNVVASSSASSVTVDLSFYCCVSGQCQLSADTSCYTTLFSCQAICTVASSAASSAISVPLPTPVCANGTIEPGEQCEIGVPCPAGLICSASCTCPSIVVSSVASSVRSGSSVSSVSSVSSAIVYCGNGIKEGSEECENGVACAQGTTCTNCRCSSVVYCGDGTVQTGEDCERNTDCPQGEICNISCRCSPGTGGNCGNGVMEAREECERGTACTGNKQCNNCMCINPPLCGNSMLERGEVCEVGKACTQGLTCVNCQCQTNVQCGNGTLEAGEQCELDSQCLTGQVCNRSSCRCEGRTAGVCGDGVLGSTEQCELGNPCTDYEKACNLSNCLCTTVPVGPACGNAQIDSGEDCDIGVACAEGTACNFANCHCDPQVVRCGNASLEASEECEIGMPCTQEGTACSPFTCTCVERRGDTVCGNGQMDTGEECEVGSPCPFGWGCDYPRCLCQNQPVCGDDALDLGEQCEVSLACTGSNQTCDFSRCRCTGQVFVCSNGTRDPGEQCDDGNGANGDGCSSNCQREQMSLVGALESCGDGIVQPPEECDDANAIPGDGCAPDCIFDLSVGDGLVVNAQGQIIVGHGSAVLGSQFVGGQEIGADGKSISGLNGRRASIIFPQWRGRGSAGEAPELPTQNARNDSWQNVGSLALATDRGPVGDTGPASMALMAAGAAAGMAFVRRRRR